VGVRIGGEAASRCKKSRAVDGVEGDWVGGWVVVVGMVWLMGVGLGITE